MDRNIETMFFFTITRRIANAQHCSGQFNMYLCLKNKSVSKNMHKKVRLGGFIHTRLDEGRVGVAKEKKQEFYNPHIFKPLQQPDGSIALGLNLHIKCE